MGLPPFPSHLREVGLDALMSELPVESVEVTDHTGTTEYAPPVSQDGHESASEPEAHVVTPQWGQSGSQDNLAPQGPQDGQGGPVHFSQPAAEVVEDLKPEGYDERQAWWIDRVSTLHSVENCRSMWTAADEAGHLSPRLRVVISERAHALEAQSEPATFNQPTGAEPEHHGAQETVCERCNMTSCDCPEDEREFTLEERVDYLERAVLWLQEWVRDQVADQHPEGG